MRYSSTPFRFVDFAFMILSSHTPSAASLMTRSSILESVFECLFRVSVRRTPLVQEPKSSDGGVDEGNGQIGKQSRFARRALARTDSEAGGERAIGACLLLRTRLDGSVVLLLEETAETER